MTDEESADAVRACTFNVRCDTPDDEQRWADRRGRVLETIRDLEPDLLGVQEALSHQYDDLREGLDGWEFYGVGRRDGDREGEFVPVAWRTDRFEALETGAFWLSETPGEPSVGWDASLPRVTTWASLRERDTGARIWYCNTHFDHRGERARYESARLLRDRVADRVRDGPPVVVTGDFNATPDSKPYDVLVDGGAATTRAVDADGDRPLVDTRRVADRAVGPKKTFHGWSGDLEERIDYVFVSPDATVERHRTLEPRSDGCYRSDHVPVTASIRLDG